MALFGAMQVPLSKAEEARALAKIMEGDPDAKQRMLDVASSYDQLAELAAIRQKAENRVNPPQPAEAGLHLKQPHAVGAGKRG